MAIINLDHTIVPAKDNEESARFFARIMGLQYEGPHGHFAPVKLNDTLTLDFDNREDFEHHHYAFHVTEEDFDAIFAAGEGRGAGLRQRSPCPRQHADQHPARRPRFLLQGPQRPQPRAAYSTLGTTPLAARYHEGCLHAGRHPSWYSLPKQGSQ